VQHIKALRGPFPNVALIPTGGVNSSNAAQYIAAGAFALGAGSDLVDVVALREGNLAKITRGAEEFVAVVTAAREARARQSKR
jgi:2-dehydro-3-deoxyphosphogluconate aldolase/(4S)-4-hydroxy-2-oxoglutarate aldolase